jgi:hypothetical protein
MAALQTDLRNLLETTIKRARVIAEDGATRALEALAVGHHEPHGSMSPEERKLRRRLRAHGRQLGDELDRKRGTQTTHRLMREVAYEHWHRMLFARFLAENHLLIHPDHGVAISMEECHDLARETGRDAWAMAASYAEGMLPQIFRADDPALAVTLPPEARVELQKLLSDLPAPVFRADDSLGWTYQFWQASEKDAVNARAKSGEKITGETLPAVTQLFTEPYMVDFLLHNTLGAWHGGKVLSQEDRKGAGSEEELRGKVRLSAGEGYDFDYLRFVREAREEDEEEVPTGPWRPAAGIFDGWPREAGELKVLDPCCGSGHFLVSAFQILARLRMEEEGLSRAEAARAVVADNLFGLELDSRCTQIAAFNLAFTAWRFVGEPIELPPMRIACSGIGPRATREEWLKLAEEAAAAGGMPGKKDLFGSEDTLLSAGVKGGLEALYDAFERAPDLGSLIDLRGVAGDGDQADALRAGFDDLEPLLDAILEREGLGEEETERAVAAKGMAEAARILAGPAEGYTLVVTNVPYLGRGSHTYSFKAWADHHYREARNDLATIFVARMLRWVENGKAAGTVAAVTPQNWLFLTSYRKLRERLLKERAWNLVARLGPGAFETISGHVVNVALMTISAGTPQTDHLFAGLDVKDEDTPILKALALRSTDREEVRWPISQNGLSRDPDARLVLLPGVAGPRLSEFVHATEGLSTGDLPRISCEHWEVPFEEGAWEPMYGGLDGSVMWGGRLRSLRWEDGDGPMKEVPGARFTGLSVLGQDGVVIRQMGALSVTRYTGEKFDDNLAVLVPEVQRHLAPLWCFLGSEAYTEYVRAVDPSLKVTCSSLVAVPFDLERWQKVAEEKYPDGLPEPYSDDPTQWLYHGHPAHAESGTELHVALARLLGYRWPAELDEDMRLSDEARALIQRSAELDAHGHTDNDGIVCLSSLRGEGSAADRLRALLGTAFGSEWSTKRERELLAATANAAHGRGKPSRSLDAWLRTSFFEEHCKLFQHRPFIWHIWDGLKNGFNALVNYHRLAGPDGEGRKTLEALTYSYLGEWIDRQRQARERDEAGADARLAAALKLQEELAAILEGEPPYDLFIRWKPLHEQPIGWEPDINDGVRLNIRPFMIAEDVGRKGAGILRFKPNCKWTKDRGKEPQELRPRQDFPWFWSYDPKAPREKRIDFGAGTNASPDAGTEFDGARWNDLHYTRAAKQAARKRRRDR